MVSSVLSDGDQKTDGDKKTDGGKARVDATDRPYSFAQAIELAGNGCYNMTLLATLSLALMSMGLDMFSFSLVVSIGSCDMQLTGFQKNVLVSMPFLGPIFMAYTWGYICDTRGRKSSLLVALGVGFITSTIGAFSPHWAMLAVCRLVSTCFCSCAQSATYTLIGESCPERVKGGYMLFMTSIIHFSLCVYYSLAYFVTNLGFSFDLGFISFVPWRLLVLIFAMPMGISALLLFFFYESPKFLLNAGREEEALDVLRRIYRRNGGDISSYPVQKLFLGETGNVKVVEDQTLWQSLLQQTMPLFKPPYLANTLILYYLIFCLYSTNSALIVWFPFLAGPFSVGIYSNNNETQGLCEMVHEPQLNATVPAESCTAVVDLPAVLAIVIASICTCILSALISKLASRKKLVTIAVFCISFISGIGGIFIRNNISSVVFYFGLLLNSLNMGVLFSYCVDLYPTSFRGMATCLGVMVARLSGVVGVNVTGPFIRSECEATFYVLTFFMLSAALVAFLLPKDRLKKVKLIS